LTLSVLCHLSPRTRGYSRGAPRSTCGGGTNASMTPRHGFSPQTRPSPAYIVVDQTRVVHTDYVRVTIRSSQAFKGFLVTAVNDDRKRIGSWTIPYGDTSSQYVHCDNLQDTVTHTDHSSLRYVLSLSWKPPTSFSGNVTMVASVVMDYQTYWTGITSDTITVIGDDAGYDDIMEIVTIRVYGENDLDHGDDFEDYYYEMEDNYVLESVVVSNQVMVDFQKRSTENEEEPTTIRANDNLSKDSDKDNIHIQKKARSSDNLSDGLKKEARSNDENSEDFSDGLRKEARKSDKDPTYRSILLWPSKSETTKFPGFGKIPQFESATPTTSRTSLETTTFDAWWRLPVTVSSNTDPDKFFRPTFFAENSLDRVDKVTTTHRSVLLQPKPKAKPKPTPEISKPIPTVDPNKDETILNQKHDDHLLIPVFITHRKDTIEGNDEYESDIGNIPFDHFYNKEEEDYFYLTTFPTKFNRLQLDNNQNEQTTKKYTEKKINILEINEVLNENSNNIEPYNKMESEYGSWENSASSITHVHLLLCFTIPIFLYGHLL